MKKRLFATLAIFTTLVLTACGGGNSGGGKSSGKKSSHTHTAAENAPWQTDDNNHWKDCKDNDNGKVDNKAHTWISDPDHASEDVEASCKGPGVAHEKCSVCGKTRERTISNDGMPHTWVVQDSTTPVGANDMSYDKVKCSVCQAEGIWAACKDMTINGSDKGGAPEGCIKLSNKNETMTAVLNLPEAKTGTLYFRGVMDYWHDGNNDNQNKMYSSVKDNSNTANFAFTVNGTAVDFSANLNTPFSTWLPEEAGETVNGTAYSQLGDCPVGAVSLNAGDNTLQFTRVDSYNMAIKYFLVVFNA